MTWKKINIREELYDRVAALAGRGSVSSMFEEIVLVYFKQAGEVEAAGQTVAGVAQTSAERSVTGEVAGSIPVPGSQSDSRPTPVASTSSHEHHIGNTKFICTADDDSILSPDILAKREARKKDRKSTCPHRIPPGSYCRVCDQ